MREKITKILTTVGMILAIAFVSSVAVSCADTHYDVTINYTIGDGSAVEETYDIYSHSEPSVEWSFEDDMYMLRITFYDCSWLHKKVAETSVPITINSFNIAKRQ